MPNHSSSPLPKVWVSGSREEPSLLLQWLLQVPARRYSLMLLLLLLLLPSRLLLLPPSRLLPLLAVHDEED